MDKNVLVTIGIPVYNAATYIEKCVVSVLNQTMSNIELLIVDDKGTDNSIQIIKDIVCRYPNGSIIRIVEHSYNMGVAHARNTIVHEAKGKYLFLMDSDDYLNPDSIEKLYNKAVEFDAETVWGSSIEIFSENSKSKLHYGYPDLLLLGENQLINYECKDLHENLQHSIWNILYKMDFIRNNNLLFEQHGYFDDTIFHAKMQPLVRKAVLLSDITYNYYMRPTSLSNFQYREHFQLKEATDAFEASEIIIKHCYTLRGKPYFDVKCAKVMKQAFFMICGILKHQDKMDQPFPEMMVKKWFQHPASFAEILGFKRYRATNFFFKIIGKLPASLMVKIISIIGKKKHFI